MHAFTFAEYPGVSRHLMLAMQGGSPEEYLNGGLDWFHAGFTHDAFWERLPPGTLQGLTPLSAGWRRFGVVIGMPVAEGGPPNPRVLLRLETSPVQVCIVQEWNPARAASAWEALLIAQDALRPQRLAVPPGFLVSLMALAKLAAHQGWLGGNTPARWIPSIALAQQVLSPLLDTLMQTWLAGSTIAAARYRAQMGIRTPRSLRPTVTLFRPAEWEGLARAERPEPFLMRLLHQKGLALWRDDALWAEAQATWSEVEQAVLLGLARWDTVIAGEGAISAAELIALRECGPWLPEEPLSSQPQATAPDPSAPRRRGRAVPQVTRGPDVPVQPSIWELEGDPEAVARQISLGGQQELELWLLLAQQRAADEARRGYQRWGRGIVALTVAPHSSFAKGEVRAEYIPQAAIVAQANSSSPGDRSVVEFLRGYDPAKEFMVVLVKDDCDPRRLIAWPHERSYFSRARASRVMLPFSVRDRTNVEARCEVPDELSVKTRAARPGGATLPARQPHPEVGHPG